MSRSIPPELSRHTTSDGFTIIQFRGDLDTYGVRQVSSAFAVALAERTMRVIVDLNEVTFLTSAALGMFVMHAQAVTRAGGSFDLAGGSERVRETIDLAGFGNIIHHHDSVDDAIIHLTSTDELDDSRSSTSAKDSDSPTGTTKTTL